MFYDIKIFGNKIILYCIHLFISAFANIYVIIKEKFLVILKGKN